MTAHSLARHLRDSLSCLPSCQERRNRFRLHPPRVSMRCLSSHLCPIPFLRCRCRCHRFLLPYSLHDRWPTEIDLSRRDTVIHSDGPHAHNRYPQFLWASSCFKRREQAGMRVSSARLHFRHSCFSRSYIRTRLVDGDTIEDGRQLIRCAEVRFRGALKSSDRGAVLFSSFPGIQHLIHDIECGQVNLGPSARMPYHRVLKVFSSHHERQDIWRRRERTVRQCV